MEFPVTDSLEARFKGGSEFVGKGITLGVDGGKGGIECSLLALEQGGGVGLEDGARSLYFRKGGGRGSSNFGFNTVTKALSIWLSENIGNRLINSKLDLGMAGLNGGSGLGNELFVMVLPIGVRCVGPIAKLNAKSVVKVLGEGSGETSVFRL